MFGTGALGMVVSIFALGSSAASIGISVSLKKKKSTDNSEDEE